MSTILVFCAHPDDEILGVGGTIAKYTKEGKRVICIMFTSGESSHPWLHKRDIHAIRQQEAKQAGSEVGVEQTIFLSLRDGLLQKDAPQAHERLLAIIEKYTPEKIFTHDIDDIHPDHKAVYHAVTKAVDAYAKPVDVYTFTVWFLAFRKKESPKLVIDITPTFTQKYKALKHFKSQWLALVQLVPILYIKSFLDGLDADSRYAEIFYKIR
ncbi:MAG: PIG-L deacetylase family protein [Candidatus Woesearchaeota archaeon]